MEEILTQSPLESLTSSPPTAECWCDGSGFETHWNTQTDRMWHRYCVCEKGQRYGEADRARRGELYIENSKIPARFYKCDFDSYPVSEENAEVVQALRDWWPDDTDGRGFFLYGDYGTGKTGLACAMLHGVLKEGAHEGMFVTVSDLLDDIKATYGPDSKKGEATILTEVRNAGILVLDDLGAERPTEWVVEKLFGVINYRHGECLPTIFTSNLALPELAERLGERTTWRIAEMSEVVHLKGPNLRVKK